MGVAELGRQRKRSLVVVVAQVQLDGLELQAGELAPRPAVMLLLLLLRVGLVPVKVGQRGAVSEQDSYHLEVARPRGQVQRRRALVVERVDLGAVAQDEPHALAVAIQGGVVQTGEAGCRVANAVGPELLPETGFGWKK